MKKLWTNVKWHFSPITLAKIVEHLIYVTFFSPSWKLKDLILVQELRFEVFNDCGTSNLVFLFNLWYDIKIINLLSDEVGILLFHLFFNTFAWFDRLNQSLNDFLFDNLNFNQHARVSIRFNHLSQGCCLLNHLGVHREIQFLSIIPSWIIIIIKTTIHVILTFLSPRSLT